MKITNYHTDPTAWPVQTLADDPSVTAELRGKSIHVSPAIGVGEEQNHHQVVLEIEGEGSLNVHLGHAPVASQFDRVLSTYYYTIDFKNLGPGRHVLDFPAQYGNRRVHWWIFESKPDIRVVDIQHTYRQTPTSWLHDRQRKQVDYLGGRMNYFHALPPNFDPNEAYPLVVSVGGSGELGDDARILVQTDPGCILCKWRHSYEGFPAHHVTIQIPYDRDFTEPIPDVTPDTASPYHDGWNRYYDGRWYGWEGLKRVLDQFPYKVSRRYLTGFSGGGLFCYNMLRFHPEVFDAVVPVGAWPIGRAYEHVQQNPYWEQSYNGGDSLLERLKREQIGITPVIAVSGDRDNMKYGMQAYADHIRNSKLALVKANHGGSPKVFWRDPANAAWLFRQGVNRMKLTAEGSGYYIVYRDGVKQTNHLQEREAIEACSKLLDEYPEAAIYYEHDYKVKVEP